MRTYISIIAFCTLTLRLSAGEITVAAASSLRAPLEKIAEIYKERFNSEVKLVFASSGKLASQVQYAAPYDIFISADMNFGLALFEEGLTDGGPRPLANGYLALWSSSPLPNDIYPTLTDPLFGKIAIPNPEFAPYGKLAYDFLKDEMLENRLDNKLIIGSNVSQVNQYIHTDQVQMAITSWTTRYQLGSKGYWKKLSSFKLVNTVSLLQSAEDPGLAKSFIAFLFSEEAREILSEYGLESTTYK